MQELVALLQSAEKVPNDSDECGFDLEPLPLAPLSTLQVKPQAEVLSEIFSSRRISYTSLEVPLLPEFEGSAMLSEESEGSQIYKPSPVQSNYIQSAAPLLFAAQQNVDIPNVGLTQPQAVVVPCSAEEDKGDMQRYRNYQSSQWMDRYQELMQFRQEHGHLFVPHSYPPNQKLAQWVKRQRYQYKLKMDGKHSTLSDKREEMLSKAGFIWGSHAACWQEHFQSLEAFYLAHGHCCVPMDYKEDPSLAVWMKHQRRNYKLYMAGKPSTMTKERLRCLQSINFEWSPRSGKKSRC